MEDPSTKKRANNNRAQKTYRQKVKLGYVPNSNGRRGRPRLPGSWSQDGEFLITGPVPVSDTVDDLSTIEDSAAQNIQLQPETRTPSAPACADNACANTQQTSLEELFGPVVARSSDIEVDDQVEGQRKPMQVPLPWIEEGMSDTAHTYAPLPSICTSFTSLDTPSTKVQQRQQAALSLPTLAEGAYVCEEPPQLASWASPHTVQSYETFPPGAGLAAMSKTCRVGLCESTLVCRADVRDTARYYRHPTPLDSNPQGRYQKVQCTCSHPATMEDKFCQHASNMVFGDLMAPSHNVPLAVVYMPVMCQPQDVMHHTVRH
ncbi:hypothetical protein J1614_010727 [Plenodomus biglobosus]|nr:hypothetical protein J1614_010727 [Plenodomus biglobosus]